MKRKILEKAMNEVMQTNSDEPPVVPWLDGAVNLAAEIKKWPGSPAKTPYNEEID